MTDKAQDMNGKEKELRTQPLDPSIAYVNGIPQPQPFDDFAEAYAVHTWVYAGVRAIMRAIGSVEILPYIEESEGSWVVNKNHPLLPLLKRPNPYISGRDLRNFTFVNLALTGNAYWALERMKTQNVKELWPLPTADVRPVTTPDKFISHYFVRMNGQDVRFEANEIIQFREMSPVDLRYGVGAISPIVNTLISDINASIWNKSLMENSGKMDGVLQTDQPMQDDDIKRLRKMWQKMYEGAKNAGKTAILFNGMKYQQLGLSMKDADFVNLRKQARDEVLAVLNVPPAVVGLLEFANYSNMKEQMKSFWTNTLIPMLGIVEDTLTMRAAQVFNDQKTIFQGDLSKIEALRANETERATTTKTYVDSGIPINQVIEALDLPFEAIEGGDMPRLPPAPGGFGAQEPQGEPPAKPPKPPKDDEAKGIKSLTKDVDEVEEKKLAEWKRFDAHLRGRETAFEGSMRAFFKGQRRRVIAAIEANASKVVNLAKSLRTKASSDAVGIVFDLEKENELMKKAAGRHIRGTYFEFAIAAAKRAKPGFDFNLQDPHALAWIANKTVKLVQEANAYTLEQISDAVVDGIEQALAGGFAESETIAQIVDRIEEVYDFAAKGRAERIARTEVISASNAGAHEGMKSAGVETKAWLSSRDERVRETHRRIEDQGPIPMDDAFISPSGEKLLFPGDPSASPDEIINCRCALIAKIE